MKLKYYSLILREKMGIIPSKLSINKKQKPTTVCEELVLQEINDVPVKKSINDIIIQHITESLPQESIIMKSETYSSTENIDITVQIQKTTTEIIEDFFIAMKNHYYYRYYYHDKQQCRHNFRFVTYQSKKIEIFIHYQPESNFIRSMI